MLADCVGQGAGFSAQARELGTEGVALIPFLAWGGVPGLWLRGSGLFAGVRAVGAALIPFSAELWPEGVALMAFLAALVRTNEAGVVLGMAPPSRHGASLPGGAMPRGRRHIGAYLLLLMHSLTLLLLNFCTTGVHLSMAGRQDERLPLLAVASLLSPHPYPDHYRMVCLVQLLRLVSLGIFS